MASIPETERAVTSKYWSWLLGLAARFVMNRLLKRLGKHWLVQLASSLDLAPLEKACAAFHHAQGPGAPPQHTVARLVRALMVKYLMDLSLRETEEALQRDLLLKWFVGYGLWEDTPDHTTLERFELWVIAHKTRLFFDQTLEQIDRDLPEERERPQLIDSYALRSRAARVSLVTLLRQMARKLLEALAEAHPLRHTLLLEQLDRQALFGSREEDHHWSRAEVRQKALQALVPQVWRCRSAAQEALKDTPPSDKQRALRDWLDRLNKVLQDELVVQEPTKVDDRWQVRECTPQERGHYRIASATDPEATYRDHGKDHPAELGYNLSILTTTRIVREVQAETGASPDDQAVGALLRSQQEHHDVTPTTLIGDGAYARGKTHAEVAEISGGQTQMVTPPPAYDKRTERFGPYDFSLSDDGSTLTCPHEVASTQHYASGSGEGEGWRFTAAMCAGCPLWAKCRDPHSPASAHRMVFISQFRAYVLKSGVYAKGAQYKALIKLRPMVERVIFCLTNLHGDREAARFGQHNAWFQALMHSTAFNLRQWMRLRAAQQRPEIVCAIACERAYTEDALVECVLKAA